MPDPNKTLGNSYSQKLAQLRKQGEQTTVTPRSVENIGDSGYDSELVIPTPFDTTNGDVKTMIEKYRGDKQGLWSEVGNGLGRIIPNTALSIIGNVGSILDFEDYYNTDNEVGNWLTQWTEDKKKDVNQYFNIYNSGDMGSREWWISSGSSLIESAGSFVLTGGAIGNGMKFLNALGKVGNAAGTVINATALNQAESIPIAINVYKDAYNSELGKYQLDIESGKMTIEQAEEKAKITAADAAAYSININRLNIPLNLTSLGALMKSPSFLRRELLDLSKKSALKHTFIEGMQEYGEETINMIAEKEARRLADQGNNYSFDIGRTVNDIASKEGLYTGILGFIGGGLQTGGTEIYNRYKKDVTSYDDNGNIQVDNEGNPIFITRKEAQIQQESILKNYQSKLDALNGSNNTPGLKEVLDKASKLSKNLNDIQGYASENNVNAIKDVQNDILIEHVLQAGKLGQLDKLESTIETLIKQTDAKERFGDDYLNNYNTVKQNIKDLEKIFNDYVPKESIVTDDIFKNRAKHYFGIKKLGKLNEDINSAQNELNTEINNLSAFGLTSEIIKDLPAAKKIDELRKKGDKIAKEMLSLNEEYSEIIKPEYTQKILNDRINEINEAVKKDETEKSVEDKVTEIVTNNQNNSTADDVLNDINTYDSDDYYIDEDLPDYTKTNTTNEVIKDYNEDVSKTVTDQTSNIPNITTDESDNDIVYKDNIPVNRYKRPNAVMTRFYNHYFNKESNFRLKRDDKGFVEKTNSQVSNKVNNPDFLNKGSVVTFKKTDLNDINTNENNSKISNSKYEISKSYNEGNPFKYTDKDLKFDGDLYNANIGIYSEDGTLVGYYPIPHAIKLDPNNSSQEEIDQAIATRNLRLKNREAILSNKIKSTKISDKGKGVLLTSFKNNNIITHGNLFSNIRDIDKVDGKPVFIYDKTGKEFDITGSDKLRDKFKGIISEFKNYNTKGRIYQLVKTANNTWGLIPVFSQQINANTADKIISIIRSLSPDSSYNEIISALNDYIYISNKKESKPSLEISGDIGNWKFTINGNEYSLKQIIDGARLTQFKEALLTKNNNISISNINDIPYQNSLKERNALTTNAYTDNGNYFVQPYIELDLSSSDVIISTETDESSMISKEISNDNVNDIIEKYGLGQASIDLDDMPDIDDFSRKKEDLRNISTLNKSKAEKFIKNYVPFLTLSDIDEVSKVKGIMQDAVGMLRKSTIYLFQGSTNKTLYHEAFHGVFRNILTKDEQSGIIKEAKQKYSKPSEEDIKYYISEIPKVYTDKYGYEYVKELATNKYYEEKVADEFAEYADNLIEKPWYNKILDFFNRIFKIFNIFNKTSPTQTELIFSSIMGKKYSDKYSKPIVYNKDLSEFDSYKRTDSIKGFEKVQALMLNRVNQISSDFVRKYFNMIKKGKTPSNEEALSIFEDIFKTYEDYIIKESNSPKPNVQKMNIAAFILKNKGEFMEKVKKTLKTSYKIKMSDNVIDLVNNEINPDTKASDPEINMQGNMSKEYGQEMINISGITSASTRLKLALSFVPIYKDGVIQKDMFDFDKYYNNEDIYYWLERNLIGSSTIDEMLERIDTASIFRPELKQVYEMLSSPKQGDDINEHKMFVNEFKVNFSKQQQVYFKVVVKKEGNINKFSLVYNNREGLGKEIFDEWINNVLLPNKNTIADFDDNGLVLKINGTNKAKKLYETYEKNKDNYTEKELSNILQSVGIEYGEGVLKKLMSDKDKYPYVKSQIEKVIGWYAEKYDDTIGRKALSELVKYEVTNNINKYTSSTKTVEGENIYTIQHSTYTSKLMNTIKDDNSFDAWYNEMIKDPIFRNNNLLKELYEKPDFRREGFNVFYMDGLTKASESSKGSKWVKMHSSDTMAVELTMFQNKIADQNTQKVPTAYYSNTIEADKVTHTVIQSRKYSVNLTNNNGKITLNPNSEIVNRFYNVFLSEAGRIHKALKFKNQYLNSTDKDKEELTKNLYLYYDYKAKSKPDSFNGFAYHFHFIDSLNGPILAKIHDILSNSDDNFEKSLDLIKDEVKQILVDTLVNDNNSVGKKAIKEALTKGLIKKENNLILPVTIDIDGTDINQQSQNTIRTIIEATLNQYLNNIEWGTITNGDPAFYKTNKELAKRFYQSNGATRSFNEKDLPELNISVIKDYETGSDKETLEILKGISDKFYESGTNVTDAEVYITGDLFKQLKNAEGSYTKATEKAIAIAEGKIKPDNNDDSWKRELTIIKPFGYGQIWDAKRNMYVPIQLKCSMFPMFKSMLEYNPLLTDMFNRMNKTGANVLATTSSLKAALGLSDSFEVESDKLNNLFKLPMKFFGTQVDNPDHMFNDDTNSNRQIKMILPAVINPSETYNGRSGKDIQEELLRLEAARLSGKLDSLMSRYGTKEFNEDIAERLTSRNADDNLEELMSLNEDGKFIYPLTLLNENSTQNMLASIFTKTIGLDIKGGSAVQVSGLGFKYKTLKEQQKEIESNKELLSIQSKLKTDIKYIRNKEGNIEQIEYIDAVMPVWTKEFFDDNGELKNINNIPDELKQLIIYRIPTEGPHSTMSIRVKQFLPVGYSNMIILPYEVTKQVGADFDFDKMYFLAPEITKDSLGNLIKVNYDSDMTESGIIRRYKNYVDKAIKANYKKLPVEMLIRSNYNAIIKGLKNQGLLLGTKTNDKVSKLIEDINDLEKIYFKENDYNKKKHFEDKLWDLQAELAKIDSVKQAIEKGLEETYEDKVRLDNMIIDRLLDLKFIMSKDEFSKLPIEFQNTREQINNRILDNYDIILRDKKNLSFTTTPSGFDDFTDLFNELKSNGISIAVDNFYEPGTQRMYKDLFHMIIGLKGLSAVHVTGHAYTSMMDLKFSKPILVYDNKNKELKEYSSMSRIYSDNNTLIVRDVSSMMAAILDAVKNPELLPMLGINDKTIQLWSTLVRTGMGIRIATLFTASPAIKEASLAIKANSKEIRENNFKTNDINSIRNNYKRLLDEIVNSSQISDINELEKFMKSSSGYKGVENGYSAINPSRVLDSIILQSKLDKGLKPDRSVDLAYHYATQIMLLNTYDLVKDNSDALSDINAFFAINKEVGPNIEDMVTMKERFDKINKSEILKGFDINKIPSLASYWDTTKKAMEKMSEEFPYASDYYVMIKNTIANMQWKIGDNSLLNMTVEERNRVNKFINAWENAKSVLFEDIQSLEDKKKFMNTLRDKLIDIKNISNNHPLRNNAFIQELNIDLKAGYPKIKIKGNQYTPTRRSEIQAAFLNIFDSNDYRNLAIDLVKYAQLSSGLNTGYKSYHTFIPVEIFSQIGKETELTPSFNDYLKNGITSFNNGYMPDLSEINMLIDQMVRNNVKVFTDVYDESLFTGFDKTNTQPKEIYINDAKFEASGRLNTIKVGSLKTTEDEEVPVYQSYIRVYSTMNKQLGTLLYRNIPNTNKYELINMLGDQGSLLEINTYEDPKYSIVEKNNINIETTQNNAKKVDKDIEKIVTSQDEDNFQDMEDEQNFNNLNNIPEVNDNLDDTSWIDNLPDDYEPEFIEDLPIPVSLWDNYKDKILAKYPDITEDMFNLLSEEEKKRLIDCL